jgi:hypothetical protein
MLSGRTWVCGIRPQSHPCLDGLCQRFARADRLSILLSDWTPSWCLLHELAHAMTSHADGRSDGHGPLFMGIYVQLIARYLRLDRQTLIGSLRDSKIDILYEARPVFLDPPARTATTRS